jgi:hypothetical protein
MKVLLACLLLSAVALAQITTASGLSVSTDSPSLPTTANAASGIASGNGCAPDQAHRCQLS